MPWRRRASVWYGGVMEVLGITPILNVSDVPASLKWFEVLGWTRRFTYNDGGMMGFGADAPDRNERGSAGFAAVGCGKVEVFLCRDAQGGRGRLMTPAEIASESDATPLGGGGAGVWMSWWVETPAHVDAAHELALRSGVQVSWPPTDEPWGVRECRIVHPDGHVFRISSGLRK